LDLPKHLIDVAAVMQRKFRVIASQRVARCAPDDRLREAIHFPVIPGRAEREPGIHIPDRGYGFRACAKWRIPE